MTQSDADPSGPNPIADTEALRRDLLTERYQKETGSLIADAGLSTDQASIALSLGQLAGWICRHRDILPGPTSVTVQFFVSADVLDAAAGRFGEEIFTDNGVRQIQVMPFGTTAPRPCMIIAESRFPR